MYSENWKSLQKGWDVLKNGKIKGFIHIIILHKCYSFSEIMKIVRKDWTVLSSPQANDGSNSRNSPEIFLIWGHTNVQFQLLEQGISLPMFRKDQFPNKVNNYPRTSMFLLLLYQIQSCRDFLENGYNNLVKISKYYLQRNFFSKN